MARSNKSLSPQELEAAVKYGLLKPLNGMAFCQTGAMSTTRDKIDQIIVALGGKVHNSVSSTTDCLIVPTEGSYRKGSKYEHAMNKGVTIITEAEFCEMIFPSVEELLG